MNTDRHLKEFQYVDENFDSFVEQLRTAVQKPSIAAQNVGMEETARYFRDLLNSYGIKAETIPTQGGFPVVYGEVKGLSDKTILFYDHYDVQPPEPLEEWVTPPFSADVRDGKIFGRGVSDNKGNACARIQAVGTLLKLRGNLPLTVKFLIEGEEEIGSPHLSSFIEDHKELLKADYGVWESGYMGKDGRPGMYLGVKGMLYVELSVQCADSDMHSGAATSFPNAAWRLVWALSSMKNSKEEILIPGFYDDVLEPTKEELWLLSEETKGENPGAKENPKRAPGFLGLSPKDLRRRALFSPTSNICGFKSGYIGEGQKTVLPAKALVKMDFRLVPNQDPKDILEKLERHLLAQGFGDVKVKTISMDYPVKTPLDHPIVLAAEKAAQEVYGKPPAIAPTQGGSGPMHPFKKYLNLPMVAFGVGYWGSSNHAPNENIRLEDLRLGIKMVMKFIDKAAAI